MIRQLTLTVLTTTATAATGLLTAELTLEPFGVEIRDTGFPGAAFEIVHRDAPGYALIQGVEHQDFDLEVELAGAVDPDAPTEARTLSRAFVGIAFRVQNEPHAFAKIYLRLANGRAEDQLQRNHSTQFEALPTHPWYRLRKDAPGQYESYVDLAVAEWTTVKIEVRGARAKLFVGDAPEPVLVVADDLLEARSGRIGLWVGLATKGYFRNLEIAPVHSR